MATFVIYARLNQKDAQYCYDGIKKWFQNNPDRIDCQTETFKVRRGHLKEDILQHCEKGVVLKEKGGKKLTKKSVKKAKKAARKTK
jgi:hypothetical protein